MKQFRISRLAAMFALLVAMLIAAGCSGSGVEDGSASGTVQASGAASSAPSGQTQTESAEASAGSNANQQASATETAASGPSDVPEGAGATASPGEATAKAGTAKPPDDSEPTGGKAPTSTADAGTAPSSKPTPSASATAKPAATPPAPSATPGGKPSAAPQSGEATPSSSAAATQAPQKAEVTLSVVGDSDTGTILSPAAVELKSGDSVLDVLKRATRSRKMQMEYQGSGSAAYVEGIDNLYEFDKGAKSGWLFRVNGEFPGKSAGAVKLKAGDVVEWLYTLDMGKDVGKGTDGEEKES
ncbi:DUF4430 domain-containing protein [Cohnella sp. GbtcB17]|uniref:DUF4430 domain-containing protein n=1 Tax=Cohnella sp. GbtcB17 TaxID=2824762 RepID=UPI001C2FEF83